MEDQGTSMGKDTSLKVTKEVKFGTTVGDLRVYNEDLTPRDYDSLPLIYLLVYSHPFLRFPRTSWTVGTHQRILVADS